MIAQGLFRERNMKGEKKKRKGKAFTFHHCYKELKDEEKWKTSETFNASKKKSVVIEDEEEMMLVRIGAPLLTPRQNHIGPMEIRK